MFLAVSVERWLLLEGGTAQVTLVAALLTVNLHVVSQVVHTHKRLAALLTYVWLVCSMSFDVLVQSRREFEREATDGTLMLLAGVNPAVLLKGALVFERFITLLTDVFRDMFCLFKMIFQAQNIQERFTTLWTFMVFNPWFLARLFLKRGKKII